MSCAPTQRSGDRMVRDAYGDRSASTGDPSRDSVCRRQYPGHRPRPARHDLIVLGFGKVNKPFELGQLPAKQQQTFAPGALFDSEKAGHCAPIRG
jgi:hypothetical protein